MIKWIGSLLILGLVLFIIEVFSYLFLRIDNSVISNRLYWPPSVTPHDFQTYVQQRDPLLGWPTKTFLTDHADIHGARPSPVNLALDNQHVCASVYGDSFTFSEEVSDAEAWPNILAEKLRCQVKNYGVSGYGVDQAVLRFENNEADSAKLTILGVFPDDLNRSLNQWHYLLWGGYPLTFKPAFYVQSDGSLELEKIVVNSYEAFVQTTEAPEDLLKVEHYLPNTREFLSRVRVSFPYSASLASLAAKLISEVDWTKVSAANSVRSWNYPRWYDSQKGRSMAKIRVNTEIVKRFAKGCGVRNRRCVVLIIPDGDTIRAYAEDRANILKEVIEPIRSVVEIWDSTALFGIAAQTRGTCYYMGPSRDCGGGGHFNQDGYALLAQFVAEKIRATSPDLRLHFGSY